MREIKFRAWDEDLKIMMPEVDISAPLQSFKWLGRVDLPIMQFTGLKDKNGKEIYEGDILKSDLDTKPWLVVWRDGSFQYEPYGHCNNFNCCIRKVIGNIYSNPELLK